MEFPLGVFGIALATAVLPSMSSQAARGEHAALRSTLGFALRLSAFIAVPAAVGLVALAEPIVRLLLERGAFGAPESLYTAQALVGYAVGLPAFSATRITAQTFYALGDTRTPVLVGFVSVAANVAFALSLMWPLEHMGLALASSLSAYVNLAGLAWLLRRRLGGLGGAEIMRSLARTLGASAGLGIWCVWSAPVLGGGPLGTSAALAVGAGVYGGIAMAMRAPEIRDLLGMLRRRPRTLP
jgi:putative peptidoglycan lipid II flippase